MIKAALIFSLLFTFLAKTQESKNLSKTSFKEVTSKLDPGGDFFMYWSVEKIIKKLDGIKKETNDFIKGLEKGNNLSSRELKLANHFIKSLYEQSGVTQLSGIGMSSVQVGKNSYRSKLVLHHYKTEHRGALWRLAGSSDCVKDGFKMMPESTAAAYYGELNVDLVFKWIKQMIDNSGDKELIQSFTEGLEDLKMVFDIEKYFDSLDSEVGIFFTLDEKRIIRHSMNQAIIEFPAPGLSICAKLKNDAFYTLIDQYIMNSEIPLEVKKVGKYSIKTYTMELPPNIPVDFRPSYCLVDKHLIFSSNPIDIEKIIKAKTGKAKSIDQTERFKRIKFNIPLKGSQFLYIDPIVTKSYKKIFFTAMNKAIKEEKDPNIKKVFKWAHNYFKLNTENYFISILEQQKDGFILHSHSSESLSSLISSWYVPASGFIPIMNKARERASRVVDANNLKQIGTSLRMYADDHKGAFPELNGYKSLALLCKDDKYLGWEPDLLRSPTSEDFKFNDLDNADEASVSYAYIGHALRDNSFPTSETPLAEERAYFT